MRLSYITNFNYSQWAKMEILGGIFLSNLKGNFVPNVIQTLMTAALLQVCASFLTSSSPAC